MSFILIQNCLLLALTAQLVLQCEGCRTGWFGQDCRFQCHCAKSPKCDLNGSCPAKDKCAIGYFGLDCQFADLVADYSIRSVPPFLRDSRDTTCNPEKTATSVSLYLIKSILITWFRIVVNYNYNLLNFNTRLSGNELCSNERKFVHSKYAVDVMCDGNKKTSGLKIEGLIAGNICSIYISGGRNLALKQQTWQSSTLLNNTVTYGSGNAVDGSVDADYSKKRCSRTDKQIYSPEWIIVFDKPYLVSTIWIFTKKDHAFTLEGSLVTGFDGDNRSTFSQQTTLLELPTAYFLELNSQTMVQKITIKQSSDLQGASRFMAICEVLVFGQCQPKSYGIYCNISCSEGCFETCNSGTGKCACKLGYTGERCTECATGYYGDRCSFLCPTFCTDGRCDMHTGYCASCTRNRIGSRCEACPPKVYGPYCTVPCSPLCLDQICESVTGECKDCPINLVGPKCDIVACPVGFYGPDCTQLCPEFCEKNVCRYDTGICFSCVGNRIGVMCAECPYSFFGMMCLTKCPQHCLDLRCDMVTGFCYNCTTGLVGKTCNDVMPDEFEILLLLPLFAITLICGFLVWLFRNECTSGDDYSDNDFSTI